MHRLYSPWRGDYVTTKKSKDSSCVFCDIAKNLDKNEELGILYRKSDIFVVMNRYPYSPGHIMIEPNTHEQNLENLDAKTWEHMSSLVPKAVAMLKDTLNCTGVNVGLNLGKSAGAGIEEHLHMHLVPRWEKDTNFMTSIANSRVYSVDFENIYQKLLKIKGKYLDT